MKPSKRQLTFEKALERLNAYIKENNKRQTPEREYLLQVVCAFPAQFTAEQVQLMARNTNQNFRISRATVYNALQTFTDAQVIVECPSPNGSKIARYELSYEKGNVMMVRCSECGATHRFSDPFIRNAVMGRKFTNFIPSNYTLYVYGKCRMCRSENRRKREKDHELPEENEIITIETKETTRKRRVKSIPVR